MLLRVEDIAGNLSETTFSFSILIDFSPPTISNIQPVNGSIINTNTPILSAEFGDDLTGINTASVQILVDGVDVTSTANVSAAGFGFVPSPLSEGNHTLSIRVSDGQGNQAQSNSAFTIDSLPPTAYASKFPPAGFPEI